MGAAHVSHTELVGAAPERCFTELTDFASYPDWQSAVLEARVLDPADEHGGCVVEFEIDAKLRRVRYVLRYFWERPERIWWEYVEGDVRSVEGEFLLLPEEHGATRATYSLAIDPGRFVPGPLRRVLEEVTMRGVVRDLRARVEGT